MGEVKLERLVFFLIVSCLFYNLAIYFQNQWQPEIERNRRRFELLDKLVDEDDDFVKSTVKGAHSG